MDDKDLQIKIKAINRMIHKFNQGIVQQLIAWNKKAKVLKIQSQLGDKQKKKMIEMLVNFEGQNINRSLKKILSSFRSYKNIRNVQKRFFNVLLNGS